MLSRILKYSMVSVLLVQLLACTQTQSFDNQQRTTHLQSILTPGQQVQIQTWDNQVLDIEIKQLDQQYIYFDQQRLSWAQIKQIEYQQLDTEKGLTVAGTTSIVVLSVYLLAAVMGGIFL